MATSNPATPRCTLFYNATIITVNQRREILHEGYIRVDIDRITEIGKGKYPIELPTQTQQIDCRGKIIIPGLINAHAHLVQSLLRGLAEDLPLHNWLCDAIWPLEAVFADKDGYHATRLTTAEMLKTGTTCFLDPMLTYRAGFDQVCTAVGEMGIRGCLVCFYGSLCLRVYWSLKHMSQFAGQARQIYGNESPIIDFRSSRSRPTSDVYSRTSECS